MAGYDDIVSLEHEALKASGENHYLESVMLHKRALDLARRLDRPRLMAVLFNRLGLALEANGRVQDAVIAYESGLKALDGDPSLNVKEELRSLGSVGKMFNDYEDLPLPDLYSETTAAALEAEERDATIPVKLLLNIGNAYLLQPQPAAALNAYRRALARPEMKDAPLLRAYTLANCAEVLRQRGEVDESEQAAREALYLFDSHAEPTEKRRVLSLLAGISAARGDEQQAIELYEKALELYVRAADSRGEARSRAALGHLHLRRREFDQARSACERALGLSISEQDQSTRWHAYWGLGSCQHAAGELDEAALSLRRSLDLILERQGELRTDEGKVTFLDSVQDIFDKLISVHIDRARQDAGAYEDALEVAEEARGQALRSLMAGRERRRASKPKKLRPVDAPGADTFSANPAAQMASGVPSPGSGFNPAAQMAPGVASPDFDSDESSEQRATLDEQPDEVAHREASKPRLAHLVFHVLPECVAVFAVTPDGEVHGHVAQTDREALVARVSQLRRALRVDEQARDIIPGRNAALASAVTSPLIDYKPLLRSFYEDLIAPLAELLPANGQSLVIEPHGALWLLPFSALLTADGEWLADRWPLLYAPSRDALDRIRAELDYGRPDSLRALLVGNPTMPAVHGPGGEEVKLLPLPGAQAEALSIAELFAPEKRTLRSGSEADRESIEELMPQHGIIHLATHGIAYSEDPLASFVALAEAGDRDGKLTARDIVDLSLPADLVALSACQTGLGQVSGEGVVGLSRSFLVAGARSVLVSLWSINDEVTASLMTAFYRIYLETDDKARALQLAMREARASGPELEHPRYWAAFVIVGAEA